MSLLLGSMAAGLHLPAAYCNTLYENAGAELVSTEDLSWSGYWFDHPIQEKTTRPIRWVWHHGPEQVWAVTGLPAFRTFCAFGKWSEHTGLTQGAAALGAAGSIATPFVAGFRAK